MDSNLLFIGIYLADVLFISVLAQRCWKASLCGVIVNMILVGFWAQKSITFFGLESNLGNLFYAAVVYGMSIIAYRQTNKDTVWGIITAYVGLMMFIFMCKFATLIPGNIEYSYELMQVFIGSNEILAASFVAFFLGNMVNMYLINRSSSFFGKIRANVTTQAVDSLIFFPLAFGTILEWSVLVQWMVSGFLIKSILHVIDTPVFLLVTRRMKARQ